jgi:hypothetical protein
MACLRDRLDCSTLFGFDLFLDHVDKYHTPYSSPPQRTATVLKMWSRWKRQGKKGLGSAGKEIVLYIYRLALAK